LPDRQALGNGFTGYITSPTDILTFTNATDVVSMDYVAGGLNRAVAFCTETQNGIYAHTKPVCDRLKGSELLSIDTITAGSFKFLRYILKPAVGINEYAISFSAGFNKNDHHYILQSEWMTDNYAAQDTMFNFQLWSSDISLLYAMLNNVLLKLKNDMPISQIGPGNKPSTYIVKAERDVQNQLNLKLTVKNNTTATSGTMIIAGKANEQSTTTISQSYPVSFLPNAVSTITIPLKDMAEAEIRLKINGSTEDFVYSSDGIWTIYKTPSTQVSEFSINNDTIRPQSNEYRLFRNVRLKAVTSDYVTVYRMVKGGGVAADFSTYQYLKFNASGTGNMRIRLMKKSVTNFGEQYEYMLPLTDQNKEYIINTDAFKSTFSTLPIQLNDITIVSFTYEVTSSSTTINTSLNNVRFAGKTETPALTVNQLSLYPNPARSQVNLAFESVAIEPMHIELINIANAQVVFKKQITAMKGSNIVSFALPQSVAAGMYMLKLQSSTQRLISKLQIQ
jgi:Secretion system C-terminal sorting domain